MTKIKNVQLGEQKDKQVTTTKNNQIELANHISPARARLILLRGRENNGNFSECMTDQEKSYIDCLMRNHCGPHSIENALEMETKRFMAKRPRFKIGDSVQIKAVLSKILICKGHITGHSPGVGYTIETTDGALILAHESQITLQSKKAKRSNKQAGEQK